MNIRIKTKDSITGFTIPCREQIDKLNYLAKRLDSFDGKEMITFYAVAYGEKIDNIDILINLTFNTHCASVVRDFSNIDAIVGKSMYLTEQGGVTMEELNQLNGEEYLIKLLADKPNPLVTPCGIVYKNKNEFEQVYEGIHFPEYYWEENMGTVTLSKDGFNVDLVNFLKQQGEKLIRSGRDIRLESDHSITVRNKDSIHKEVVSKKMWTAVILAVAFITSEQASVSMYSKHPLICYRTSACTQGIGKSIAMWHSAVWVVVP